MITNIHKQITKLIFKIKGKPYKQLYNYHRFGKPINQKLSEGLLKIRSREYSRHKFPLKFQFCRRCFSFKNLQRHHLDYKNPDKIKILCRKCHWIIYKKNP